jgi:proline iminopeptidase
VTALYREVEPFAHGMLDVGDGNRVHWEARGNPDGKPALAVHGGPGSGCSAWWARLFDPDAYRVVLFDQRGCGRSTPHAGDFATDLAANTTVHLLADMEQLREHLDIERWLIIGASWGSTLALAYAGRNPTRVSELVLFGVTTGRHVEFDWTFRGGAALMFPAAWELLRNALPERERVGDVVDAYARLLNDADLAVRERAALEWCLWESATPHWPPKPKPSLDSRYADPRFRMAFARIVTHYVSHNGWLEDGSVLRDAADLADIPSVLLNGRYDLEGVVNARELERLWPKTEVAVVEDAGHSAGDPMGDALVRATNRFARTSSR